MTEQIAVKEIEKKARSAARQDGIAFVRFMRSPAAAEEPVNETIS